MWNFWVRRLTSDGTYRDQHPMASFIRWPFLMRAAVEEMASVPMLTLEAAAHNANRLIAALEG